MLYFYSKSLNYIERTGINHTFPFYRLRILRKREIERLARVTQIVKDTFKIGTLSLTSRIWVPFPLKLLFQVSYPKSCLLDSSDNNFRWKIFIS